MSLEINTFGTWGEAAAKKLSLFQSTLFSGDHFSPSRREAEGEMMLLPVRHPKALKTSHLQVKW